MKKNYKLTLFDMDGTLLKGRSIFFIAEKKGFSDQLSTLLNSPRQPYEKSIEIAKLLRGFHHKELLRLFRQIPLQDHVEVVLSKLHNRQIKTALVTDGYQRFANDLKKRLGLDYAFANQLIFNNQMVTGDILFQNKELRRSSDGNIYSINKQSVLEFLCMILDISNEEVIAIGDGYVDVDMIKTAGLGVAYRAPPEIQHQAALVTDDLQSIFPYIEG